MDLLRDYRRKNEEEYRLVVRLRRSAYATRRGLAEKTELLILKRKSSLDFYDVGLDDFDEGRLNILNLDDSPDGVYELRCCNESRDWETGIIDDWDVELVPFKEML